MYNNYYFAVFTISTTLNIRLNSILDNDRVIYTWYDNGLISKPKRTKIYEDIYGRYIKVERNKLYLKQFRPSYHDSYMEV